jgi:hypothetical protein
VFAGVVRFSISVQTSIGLRHQIGSKVEAPDWIEGGSSRSDRRCKRREVDWRFKHWIGSEVQVVIRLGLQAPDRSSKP